MSDTEILRLKRKEAELLQRLGRLRKAMNETKELNTLAFKGKLFKEAQEQLRQVQEKLASLGAK
jgi:hypothetical protein